MVILCIFIAAIALSALSDRFTNPIHFDLRFLESVVQDLKAASVGSIEDVRFHRNSKREEQVRFGWHEPHKVEIWVSHLCQRPPSIFVC
jgi:hypothetical protein